MKIKNLVFFNKLLVVVYLLPLLAGGDVLAQSFGLKSP